MAIFELEANGRTFEVEAPDMNTALAALSQAQGAPAGQDQAAVQDAFGAAAQRMRRPLTRGPDAPGTDLSNITFEDVDNTVRQVAKGTLGVGSYLDEMNAATNAGLQPLLGTGAPGESYGQRYEQNLASERGRDKAFEARNPGASTALQVGGGLASGGALLKAAPAVGNFVMGNAGASLPARMAATGAAGMAQGAVHGFGTGENFQERFGEAAVGGALGGGVGLALPAAAASAQKMAGALTNWRHGSEVAQQLGVPRTSVNRVAQNLADDEMTPALAAARSAELGPEGMVMDMGRQTLGRAEAVASMPGKGQNRVVDAVESRVRSSADRIGAELDTALGPSPNVVELEKKIGDFYSAKAKPAYDAVMNAHPSVWDDQLARLTRRPSVSRAIDDAVTLARESGDEIASPFVRAADGTLTLAEGVTPNLQFWNFVKKSLDSRIGAMARNPDPDSAGKATYGGLLDTKRALVDHLDSLTGGAYKHARDIAADKFTVKEALSTGTKIFENRMLPEEFAEHLSSMGKVERAAVGAGARRALERLRENAPANMSEGGRQVYRELLQGGPNGDTAQKLRMLLGDDVTNNVIGSAQREANVFQPAYDRIAANSRTTPRAEAIKDMQPFQAPETMTSAVNRGITYPVTGPLNAMFRQGNAKTREGIGDLLTRKDATRDATVNALLGLNASRSAATDTRTRDKLVALLLGPSVQQAERAPNDEQRRAFARTLARVKP